MDTVDISSTSLKDERSNILLFIHDELTPFGLRAPKTKSSTTSIRTNISNTVLNGLLAYCIEEVRVLLYKGFEDTVDGGIQTWKLSEEENQRIETMRSAILASPPHEELMTITLDFKVTVWNRYMKGVI